MKFQTDYYYTDRETKAKYVWLKYRSILKGRILDVGADEGYLKKYLPAETDYWGIGLGGHPDQVVNLEKEKIPFPEHSFDCVLCLDVLEHLDNIHEIFDELCRVSRAHVIISLPNPWAGFLGMLRAGHYRPDQPMKFYGLPPEPPEDRHKWFFSHEEAKNFVLHRALKNNMRVLQMDAYHGMKNWKRRLRNLAIMTLLRNKLSNENLHEAILWAVLQRKDDGQTTNS